MYVVYVVEPSNSPSYIIPSFPPQVNTPFLLARRMMSILGRGPAGSKGKGKGKAAGWAKDPLYALNWVLLLATFLWSRIYVHGYAVYVALRRWELELCVAI